MQLLKNVSSVEFEIMSFNHFQFSGITNLAMIKKGLQKYRKIGKKIILYKNYYLFLGIVLSKKDFHELERLEYQKRFISRYGKPELSNRNSFNRAKTC